MSKFFQNNIDEFISKVFYKAMKKTVSETNHFYSPANWQRQDYLDGINESKLHSKNVTFLLDILLRQDFGGQRLNFLSIFELQEVWLHIAKWIECEAERNSHHLQEPKH